METLANLVAALHIGYFLFVAGGFIGIVAGARLGWLWIYNPWFRFAHLLAVLMVVAEDVFHFPCLLNVLERAARGNKVSAPGAVSNVLELLLRHIIPSRFL